jgi:hypothetical protein
MEPEGSLPHSQVPATCPYPEPPGYQISCSLSLLRLHHSISSGSRLPRRLLGNFVCFYGDELLVSCPNPKPEDHTLSAVPRRSFTVTKFKVHLSRKKNRPSVCPSSKRNRNANLQRGSLDVTLCRGFAIQVAL